MDESIALTQQRFMWAIRQELGWPPFKPLNDCLAFVSGRPVDFETRIELSRLVGAMQKDMIHAGWASPIASEPETLTVVIREMLQIDVIGPCVAWASGDDTPVVLVSTRSDECFVVGRRGLLERFKGKPRKLAAGRKLAMKRIRAAATQMPSELAQNTVWVPRGADWIDPEAPADTIVTIN